MSLLFAQLIHANRERNSDMMEALFWKVLGHLQELSPSDGPAKRYHGLPRRFKRAIHAIDSTTIALVANCMDWAKHRRRKAPAKMHLRLNLQSFLPGFAVIEEASHHDDTRTLALCAGLQAGEIAVFDKAYVHFTNFSHLSDLYRWGIEPCYDNPFPDDGIESVYLSSEVSAQGDGRTRTAEPSRQERSAA